MFKEPVLMVVDTGRDDAWTIIGALNSLMDVKGIVATYGNSPLPKTLRNTLDVLDLAKAPRGIRVWAGPDRPLALNPDSDQSIKARWKLAGNGLANVEIPRSSRKADVATHNWLDDLAAFVKANPWMTVINIGPLTAMAQLSEKLGGSLKPHIRRIVCMGGCLDLDTPVDFNFRADALAVQKVTLDMAQGFVMVPFDETRKLNLEFHEIEALKPTGLTSTFSKNLMLEHAKGWMKPRQNIMLHDPATLLVSETGALHRPDVPFHLEWGNIASIVTEGPQTGRVILAPEWTRPIGQVTLAVFHDATRARNRILKEYLGFRL